VKRGLVILALLAIAAPARARADDGYGYDVSSKAWNGMSTFSRVADGVGLEVTVVTSLQWDEVDANDVLFLLYPLRRLDPSKVAAFVSVGGHIVIADDFGESEDAMTRLGLLRGDVGTPRARRYHDGHMWAPIADAIAKHALTEGVAEVVCNHPAVLTSVEGADTVVGFSGGDAVVVAGTRGTGRFVVASDPSIFINRMLQFQGNLTLTANMLRWLSRDGRAQRLVLVMGDIPMYGDPKSFIDDAGASPFDRKIHSLNNWLAERNDWLLTLPAMRIVGGILGLLIVIGAALTLPAWRRHQADGRWLKVERPPRKDDLERAVAAADAGGDNFVIAATALRDLASLALTRVIGRNDPLFTTGEAELVGLVTAARGPRAGAAMARCYRRLRGLPSRTQAAAPWSGSHLGRRDFEHLNDDVMDLYRSLDAEAGIKAR